MPRAPLSTTARFIKGPSDADPGAVRFEGPARFVPVDGVFMTGPGAPSPLGWVTTDSGEPLGSWVDAPFGLKPSLGDLVQVPAGGDTLGWVLYVERILWGPADYYRAVVCPLPYPEVCNCGDPIPDPPDPPPDPPSGSVDCSSAPLVGTRDGTFPLNVPAGDALWHKWNLGGSAPLFGFHFTAFGNSALITGYNSCGGSPMNMPSNPANLVPVSDIWLLIENTGSGAALDSLQVVLA